MVKSEQHDEALKQKCFSQQEEVAHATEVECAAQTLGRDATHSICYFTRDSHREARDLRDTRDARHALDSSRRTEATPRHALHTHDLTRHTESTRRDSRQSWKQRP
jgi:hypothetical protein